MQVLVSSTFLNEMEKINKSRSIVFGYFTSQSTEDCQSHCKSLVLSTASEGIDKMTDGEISKRIFGWRDKSKSDHQIMIFSNVPEQGIFRSLFPMVKEISLVDFGPVKASEEDGINLKFEKIRNNIRRSCSALCQQPSVDSIEIDPCGYPKIVAESAVYGIFHRNEIERNIPTNSYFFDADSDLSPVTVRYLRTERESDPAKESVEAFEEGLIIGECQNFARLLHGAGFYILKEEFMKHIKKEFSGLKNVKVIERDENWIQNMGMKSILQVANMNRKSSDQGKFYTCLQEPPCLLEIHYDPRETSEPIVLVGRSSFYNSFNSFFMTENRQPVHLIQNVSPGASIIATILALARLRVPVKVIGIISVCEHSFCWRKASNMKYESEYDIFSEVPDSHEERLLLKDAISYSRSFEPKLVVTIATQTNYLTEAFLTYTSAIYSTDDLVAELFLKVSCDNGERFIRLPFVDIEDDIFDKCIIEKQFCRDCRDVLNRPVPPETKNELIEYISKNYDFCFITSCCLKDLLKDYKWLHLEINKDLLFHKNNEDEVYELHEITGSPTRSLTSFMQCLVSKLTIKEPMS